MNLFYRLVKTVLWLGTTCTKFLVYKLMPHKMRSSKRLGAWLSATIRYGPPPDPPISSTALYRSAGGLCSNRFQQRLVL